MSGQPGGTLAAAWIHPALRLAYIGAYVFNLPPLRGALLGRRAGVHRGALRRRPEGCHCWLSWDGLVELGR